PLTRRAALPLLVAEATAASQGPPQSIVFLSALTFDSCLSGRTRRLAEALAAAGHDVTFVDMPSLRQVARPTSWLRRSYTSPAGVRVVRLPPLPWRARSGWPSVTSIWSSLAVRSLGRRVPGLEQAVVVASTPWWLPVARELPAWVRCYDYLDHVDVQAGPRRIEWFRRWDAELLRIADVVTTVSEPLRRHLQAAVPPERLHLVPNGVCGDWIDSPVVAAERGSLASRADAPIAGFLGALFEWVDLDLIAAVAGLLPQIEFVIVGPTRRGVRIDALLQLPNVRCHGPVPFEQVPATLAAFDVCLVPFRRDLISDYADPLKVYEYCALGKPVVSTVLFNAGGTEPPIAVAPTAEAFAAAIREALETSPADRDRWIAFARQHTWEARARQFAEIMSRTASTR
ncbi:MAG: glycosyltransferase, partial [Planctomycetes bacterium]|nr:glycosyltransferase [Planctomycetota bacterium]